MTQNRTLLLILPAFGAAIIAALAQIIIPIGAVPITLQTLAVFGCRTPRKEWQPL